MSEYNVLGREKTSRLYGNRRPRALFLILWSLRVCGTNHARDVGRLQGTARSGARNRQSVTHVHFARVAAYVPDAALSSPDYVPRWDAVTGHPALHGRSQAARCFTGFRDAHSTDGGIGCALR